MSRSFLNSGTLIVTAASLTQTLKKDDEIVGKWALHDDGAIWGLGAIFRVRFAHCIRCLFILIH
jgi:hypothetical protein